MSLKERLPWWIRVLAKIVLSRLPLQYSFWQRSHLFVHGLMDEPDYAYRVITAHMHRLDRHSLEGQVVLELGPGNGLFTAVVACALGARRTYLVDAGAFAGEDVAPYRTCATYLREMGLQAPTLDDCESVSDVLRACSALYLTRGVEDMREIPTASVDWIFSQAVLEHLRLGSFDAIVGEMRRMLSSSGMTTHQVDLKDHLGGALNNLRFSNRVWESRFMANSGFYTNRLRLSQIVNAFREAGFDVHTADVSRWTQLPTPRRKLARPFRELSDDELLVRQFDLVTRPLEGDVGEVAEP